MESARFDGAALGPSRRPESPHVVTVGPHAPRPVALREAPLPRGRRGKAGWGRKGTEGLSERSVWRWPWGTKVDMQLQAGEAQGGAAWTGMSKRCAPSTHGVASRTLLSPVSLLVFTLSGARIQTALWVGANAQAAVHRPSLAARAPRGLHSHRGALALPRGPASPGALRVPSPAE